MRRENRRFARVGFVRITHAFLGSYRRAATIAGTWSGVTDSIELLVDHDRRGESTRAEALDLDDGELAVGGRERRAHRSPCV